MIFPEGYLTGHCFNEGEGWTRGDGNGDTNCVPYPHPHSFLSNVGKVP